MITCPKCGKDNQDHYKFCLGCGAELPRDTSPKPFSPQTPAQGLRAAQGGSNPMAANASGGQAALSAGIVGLGGTVAIGPSGPAVPRPQAFATAANSGAVLATASNASAPAAAAPLAAPQPVPAPSPIVPPAPVVQPVTSPANAASPQALGQPGSAPPVPAAPNPPAVQPVAGPSGGTANGTIQCPQCGHVNSANNLFCGSCGFRLQQAVPRTAPAQPVETAGPAIVLTALRADGSEAGTYTIPGGSGIVGRETGGIFAGDSYLSPRHASFRTTGPGRAMVKDEGSLNGVYKKLGRDLPVELKPSDVFRIGQEIIRFQPFSPLPPAADGVERLGAPSKGYIGRIALVIGRDETGNAFPIPEIGVHLGRERGDILFPEDGYVSGLHCRLTWDGQRLFLTDLGSSNGTFLRLTVETEVRAGDVLLMGQQLFRIAL